MPAVLGFIGWHNAGKTTLACAVVSHLVAKGYGVAVLKSTKEQGLVPEPPGTDTSRYAQAGAGGVALLGPDQLLIRRPAPDSADLPALARACFPDADLVLVEGCKHADIPKIEVRRDPDSPLLSATVAGVLAVATDLPPAEPAERLRFGLHQSRKLADFIEARFLRKPEQP